MKIWEEHKPITPTDGFVEAVGGHPLVAETILQRGILVEKSAVAYLDPTLYKPASALELPGMDKAVARIIQAQKDHERICVWGDFDVDGQTSTALLVSALGNLGIKGDLPCSASW